MTVHVNDFDPKDSIGVSLAFGLQVCIETDNIVFKVGCIRTDTTEYGHIRLDVDQYC